MQDELDSLGSGDELKTRRDALTNLITGTESAIGRMNAIIDHLKPFAKVEPFEVSSPTFGELLAAEEHSKDWVTGVAKIDEGKLTVKLLAGNVRLHGKEPLSESDVRDLHPAIANALWLEVKAHVQNSSDRLPFLLSRLRTRSKETSPTSPD